MECENNIISNVGDAAATVCRGTDGVVELGVILNIWDGGAVLSAFVVYMDLVICFSWMLGRRWGMVCARFQ